MMDMCCGDEVEGGSLLFLQSFWAFLATFMYLLTSNHQISETERYSVYHADLSLWHVQTRHFCRPAEPHTEHLLWVGVVSFARKMARLCSRGCRLLKMSPAARSSRSLTKLLRRAQKSNATATDSIAEKPAIRSSCA